MFRPAASMRNTAGDVAAVVNVVSKAGTNKLHGSAFDFAFLRNNDLNARNYFTGLDTLKRNQFGVSLGGPVVLPRLSNGKDRTFFFFSYGRYSTAGE